MMVRMPLAPSSLDPPATLGMSASAAAVGALVVGAILLGVVAVQWVILTRRERAMRQRAERLVALLEAERRRAEDGARDKARLLGMLSHELLTPLHALWSTMDVIESQGRVEARDPAFARLRESTRSLRARIGDLVDFARMSSGSMEKRIRGFQLDKLVDAALRDLAEPLAARNLDVHWEAGADLAQRLYADPSRLRQVLDNLLSNAVKYTERGGISIHARLAAASTRLRIEVSDTGVGIRPEDLGSIWQPFWRSAATAGMAEGSGLGLAVVRNLVDLLGGTIDVQSRAGHGTSVVLEVPVEPAPEEPGESPAPSEGPALAEALRRGQR
jgi:signal transduction histidine kinase